MSTWERRVKYSSHSDSPENVFARNGRRVLAHSGPCSVMRGLAGEKYLVMSLGGGGGSRRAWQNSEVDLRRSFSRSVAVSFIFRT